MEIITMTERYYKVSCSGYELTYYQNFSKGTKFILLDDGFAKMCGFQTRTEMAEVFRQCTGDPLAKWMDITES